MSRVLEVLNEALLPLARGTGAQFFDVNAALPGVACQVVGQPIDAPDASLDFVVAGPEWWTCGDPLGLVAEWRRCLRDGASLAVLISADAGAAQAVARLLENECGLADLTVEALDDHFFLVTGFRSDIGAATAKLRDISHDVEERELSRAWRASFWTELGTLLLQLGAGRRAAECFGEAIRCDADSREARVGFALANAADADPDEAEAILRDVLGADPETSLAAEWLRRWRGGAADRTVLRPSPRRHRRPRR